MIKATTSDKEIVVEILSCCFKDNKSVRYIVKQDAAEERRIRKLMEYSFEQCHRFGEVLLSNNRDACALLLFPDKKRTSLFSLLQDVKLLFSVIGLQGLQKTMTREVRIKQLYPKTPICYLWFIGVAPSAQNNGIGTDLLKGVLSMAQAMGRPVYLETSTLKNLPWYKKRGFSMYETLDFGYSLYCLKHD